MQLLETSQEEQLAIKDCLEMSLFLETQSCGQYRTCCQQISLRLMWLLDRYPNYNHSPSLVQTRRRIQEALRNPDQPRGLM